ncbi:hypothetical protein [Inhella sp.]|uniref:hypothetical protein n=1 Tax=Inhella sp. TaxID=1921806 RepID=UPI0035B34884
MRALLSLLFVLLLTACGGGGGGGGSTGGGGTTPTTPAVPPTLVGVVSVGVPLGGAQISVVDAKGTALGSTSSNAGDGRYTLKLSAASPSLPLMLQARGIDSAGLPVLLHALVPAAANDASTTVHLTPLSQAVSALALGAAPQAAFAKPAEAKLTDTAPLISGAGTFLKTLIKTAASDAKITSLDAFDLLTDSRLATPKSAADLMLAGLRLQVDGASGKLLLGTRFLANPTPEVEVSLATAKTELAKGSTGTPASAITSTLKVTSAAASVVTNAATLDGIVSTLNPLLAQVSTSAATYKASTALTGYDKHDGRNVDALVGSLTAAATDGLQLGPLQVLGCADTVVKKGDCLRVLVASTLSDRSGKPVRRLLDAATYNTAAKRWSLIGNGHTLSFEAYASSTQLLKRDGSSETSSGSSGSSASANPFSGVEVRLQATDEAFTSYLLLAGTVQTPLGYALPLAACNQRQLCVAPTGAAGVVPTGAPQDHQLRASSVGWLGNADGLNGAAYKAIFTRNVTGAVQETRSAYLHAAMLSEVAAARHPVLDGVASATPLTLASLGRGLTLKWATWAQANPDLRLAQIRLVVRYPDRIASLPLDVLDVTEDPVLRVALTPGQGELGHDIWLTAVDTAGRRFHTRYALGISDSAP